MTRNVGEESQDPVDKRRAKLADLIRVITETAKVKGWDAHIVAEDSKNYRYATVDVKRWACNMMQPENGTFDIICDEKVKISHHCTSGFSDALESLAEAVTNEFWKLPWIKSREAASSKPPSDLQLLERLLRRFHSVVRQMKHRHDNRPALIIQDEYDVQDLLHALLRGLFDDVRPEEYTPSYAGGASRMDFLLKREQIVLEAKVASSSLRDRQIGDQLIVDIGRYQTHPDCKRLVCFVYDPLGNLKNPSGLEVDLSGARDKLEVKVIVASH